MRDGVTVTVSNNVAGCTVMSITSLEIRAFCVFSAKPPARTTIVTSPVSCVSTTKRPSGPVVTRVSEPDALRTITAAPPTTPPLES